MVQIVSAAKLVVKRYAHASLVTSEAHPIVDPNVFQTLSVVVSRLVSIRNVEIHAPEHVDSLLGATLLIITQFVLVRQDGQVIHLSAVMKLLKTKWILFHLKIHVIHLHADLIRTVAPQILVLQVVYAIRTLSVLLRIAIPNAPQTVIVIMIWLVLTGNALILANQNLAPSMRFVEYNNIRHIANAIKDSLVIHS